MKDGSRKTTGHRRCQVFWDSTRCPLVKVYQSARCHIPEDFNLHQYRCENPKTLTEVRIFTVCFNSEDIKYTPVSFAQSVELETKPQNTSTIEWRDLECSGHKNIFLCTSLLSLHFASYTIGAYLTSVPHVSYTGSGAIYDGGIVN